MNLSGISEFAVHHVVLGWVWLYTLGIPAEAREIRRAEINSDLWDQSHDWTGFDMSSVSNGSNIMRRCLRGIPADLLWRFFEPHVPARSTGGATEARRFTMHSFSGRATMTIMAVLVAATTAFTVVNTIEWNNPDPPLLALWLKYTLGVILVVIGLVLAVSGFLVMRRDSWLGATLAVSGIWIVALLFYWMWLVPLLVAAGLSLFVIGRAKKRSRIAFLANSGIGDR